MSRAWVGLTACASAGPLAVAAPPALASSYTVTGISSLGFGTTIATGSTPAGRSPGSRNDFGVIVGSGGPGGAFVGTPGHLQSLNSLIPAAAGVTITDPVGINDNGQIVANGSDSTSGNIAFLLTPS